MMAGLVVHLQDSLDERFLSRAIRDITRRVGRKAILITHSSGMTSALRAADAHREWISDVIVFEADQQPNTAGLRVHLLSSSWSIPQNMTELPRLLRSIGIELLEDSAFGSRAPHPIIESVARRDET
jgi:hypothetical protein